MLWKRIPTGGTSQLLCVQRALCAAKLGSWREDCLGKNEKYWDQDTVSIDQLDFLMIEQANTQLIMWETGQLDITTDNLPVTELDRLEKEGVLKKQPVIATRFIFLNNERAPLTIPMCAMPFPWL